VEGFLGAVQDSEDDGLPAGAATTDPETIEHGATADPGDPEDGWAAVGHVHELSTEGTAQPIGITTSKGSGPGVAAVDHTHASGLTTQGDLLYADATPAVARLPIGSAGQVLSVASGLPAWAALSALALTTWLETTPAILTADADDYDLSAGQIARVSSDASRSITGVVAEATGRLKLLVNVGANDVILEHADVGSAEANRILSSSGADITVGANGWALLYYDGTSARWRATAL
jgi:hypothetical protein